MISTIREKPKTEVWPVKLGTLKVLLQAEAAEQDESLHHFIYKILETHVMARSGSVQARELRLGNWVTFIAPKAMFQAQVQQITVKGGKLLINGSDGKNTRPIVLSREHLISNGFNIGVDRFFLSGAPFYLKPLQKLRFEVRSYQNGIIATISYVHQLQNIYSSITGEELDIKL